MLEVLCLEVHEEVHPPYPAAFPWVFRGHPSELLCLAVPELLCLAVPEVRDRPEELAFPLEPCCRTLEVHCLVEEASLAGPSIAFTFT